MRLCNHAGMMQSWEPQPWAFKTLSPEVSTRYPVVAFVSSDICPLPGFFLRKVKILLSYSWGKCVHACVHFWPRSAESADLLLLGLGRESGMRQAGSLSDWLAGIPLGSLHKQAERRCSKSASLADLQIGGYCQQVSVWNNAYLGIALH